VHVGALLLAAALSAEADAGVLERLSQEASAAAMRERSLATLRRRVATWEARLDVDPVPTSCASRETHRVLYAPSFNWPSW